MFRLWRRGPKSESRNALLWWGSFYDRKHLTIGDAHATANLSRGLAARGFKHCIVSRGSYPFESAPAVRRIADLRDDLESIVFVCGPLNEHAELRRLLERQPRARKIAVGVSVLANQRAFAERFDAVLARDGTASASFDLAPARFGDLPRAAAPQPDQPIGLCFVGRQGEYGAGRLSLHERAEGLLTESARRTGAPSRSISTLLVKGAASERDILAAFAGAQMIATTRLHGSLYGLLQGRAVVAMDQIPGGAKVQDVLGRIGWPLVLRADQADPEAVEAAFRTARSASIAEQVERARAELIRRSQAALGAAVRLIAGGRA